MWMVDIERASEACLVLFFFGESRGRTTDERAETPSEYGDEQGDEMTV